MDRISSIGPRGYQAQINPSMLMSMVEPSSMHEHKEAEIVPFHVESQALLLGLLAGSRRSHRKRKKKPPRVEVSDDGWSEARNAWFANKDAGMRFDGPDEEIIEAFRKL